MSRFLSVYVTHTDAGRLKRIMMHSLTVWQLGPIQSAPIRREGRRALLLSRDQVTKCWIRREITSQVCSLF